jgi:hypothetical protein
VRKSKTIREQDESLSKRRKIIDGRSLAMDYIALERKNNNYSRS